MHSLKQTSRVWLSGLVQRSMVGAWLLLVVCWGLTISAWCAANIDAEADARQRFAFRKAEVTGAIHTHMAAYACTPRGGIPVVVSVWRFVRRSWSAMAGASG